ncbi:MAG TPA: hypothetical protein VFN04_00210 [Protaetiibacter sp.]|nr:hypothetical protein [Protaetiibacter sp.]
MLTSRLPALALVGAIVLGLTACVADGGLVRGGSGGPSGTASPTPGASDTDDDDSSAAAHLNPAHCLVGVWQADNHFFLAAMQQFGGQVTSVEGEVLLTFAEGGSLTTSYAGWTIIAIEEGVEAVVRRDGVDSGEYSATETLVSLRDNRIGSTIVVSGQGFEMSVEPEPAAYGDASYACDAATASISTTDGTLHLRRV